ncbi:MAG: STAS domain-containing protein [bacterium]
MIEVSTQELGKAVVLFVTGDVDLYSSPEVRKELIALTEKKVKNILVDLNKVSYMDSSGVATLVEGLQQVGKYTGKLLLYGLDSVVKEVFELSRLDKVFDIYPDQDAAMEAIS